MFAVDHRFAPNSRALASALLKKIGCLSIRRATVLDPPSALRRHGITEHARGAFNQLRFSVGHPVWC
jgi:hypothetical protein